MGMAVAVQIAIARINRMADPCVRMIGARLGAGINHSRKIAVHLYLKPAGLEHLGKRARATKAVQWQYCAIARLHPEHLIIIARIGHWKHAAAISE